MDAKLYISASDLLKDSWLLARDILQSGYRPTHIIGVWRGGAPVAIAVDDVFRAAGHQADCLPLRTQVYTGIDTMADTVEMTGLDIITDRLSADSRVLIIDDVLDTGRSLKAIIEALDGSCAEIRNAVVWYKPDRSQTQVKPDYHVHETNRWLVFPHELEGLSGDEISQKPAFPADLTSIIRDQ